MNQIVDNSCEALKRNMIGIIDQYLTLVNPATTFWERVSLFFQTWEWHSGAARKRALVLRDKIGRATAADQILLHTFKYSKGSLKDLLQYQVIKFVRISKKNMDILQDKMIQSYQKFFFFGRRRAMRRHVDKILADHRKKLQSSSSIKPMFRR